MDWRKPLLARAEEVQQNAAPDARDPRGRRGILWHMPQESYDRVFSMNACYQCLTAFPIRPMDITLEAWRRSGFNHVRPIVVAERLIREGKCPVCQAEISPEALEMHDLGENPLNKRPRDPRDE